MLILMIALAALVIYSWFERRIGQQACLECGARVSADAIEEKCSNCRSYI